MTPAHRPARTLVVLAGLLLALAGLAACSGDDDDLVTGADPGGESDDRIREIRGDGAAVARGCECQTPSTSSPSSRATRSVELWWESNRGPSELNADVLTTKLCRHLDVRNRAATIRSHLI